MLFLYWGRKGGAAKYSLEISKALNLKKEVRLFLSISNQCELLYEFKQLGVPAHFVDTYTNLWAYLYRLSFGRNAMINKLQDFLRQNEIDVLVIGMDFFWGPLIYEACRREGVKSILVVHEPKPHPKESILMTGIKKFGLNRSIRGADHLVTLTEHVKKYIVHQYEIEETDITVIPHGVFSYFRAARPKQLPEKEIKKILYFGRIAHYKGLDILLKAFEMLEGKHEAIQLEIWGSGNISQYQPLISGLNKVRIENRWIDEAEITQVFKDSHICVLPYREASQSGIVGIANDAAVPVVACPAEGLKEQMKDAGAVFAADFSPKSLADVIEKLLLNPDYYSSLSSKALQYSEGLSWSSIAYEFIEVSDSLLNDSST